MLLFVSRYPDGAAERDGMMQRVSAIDRHFAGCARVYLSIRFFGNFRLRTERKSDLLTIHQVNLFAHLPFILKLGSSATRIYVHSVHNAFRGLPLYLYSKVVTDLHGVFPEELRYYGKRAGALLYGLVERLAVRRSLLLIAVTEAMADYLRNKYPGESSPILTVPVFDGVPVEIPERRHSGTFRLVYSGGSQKWQNADLMMRGVAAAPINWSLKILTSDVPSFERKAAELRLDRVEVLSVPKKEVYDHYREADLGFVLRDDSVVNRCACPTKLVEYLASGVVPIVLDPAIGDFQANGYASLGFDRFVRGEMPDHDELERMRSINREVLLRMRSAAGLALGRLAEEMGTCPAMRGEERSSGKGGSGFRTAGVVVLFHPGPELAANVASYASQLETVFAVDNSVEQVPSTRECLQQFGNVEYIANGRNLGVAAALNIGAGLACGRGFDFLLTMDQDSRLGPGMVEVLLGCVMEKGPDRVGIAAPVYLTKPGQKPARGNGCEEIPCTMTSGSLVNLSAYREVGPFLEELFIDFVDIEYCLRLRSNGFRIFRANGAVLEHRVGELRKVGILPKVSYVTSHPPLRKYYKTRNRFHVAGLYRSSFPLFIIRDRIRFVLEFFRLLLFEQEKAEKIRMMWRGWTDFRRGKMGPFDSGRGGDR